MPTPSAKVDGTAPRLRATTILITGVLVGWSLSALVHQLVKLTAPTPAGPGRALPLSQSRNSAFKPVHIDFHPGREMRGRYSEPPGLPHAAANRSETEDETTLRCRQLLLRKGMVGYNAGQWQQLRCPRRLSLLRTAAARARIARASARDYDRKTQPICSHAPLRGASCYDPDNGHSYKCVQTLWRGAQLAELFAGSPSTALCLNGTRGAGACAQGSLLCRIDLSALAQGSEDVIASRSLHGDAGDTVEEFYQMHRCTREPAIEKSVEWLLRATHGDFVRASDIEVYVCVRVARVPVYVRKRESDRERDYQCV